MGKCQFGSDVLEFLKRDVKVIILSKQNYRIEDEGEFEFIADKVVSAKIDFYIEYYESDSYNRSCYWFKNDIEKYLKEMEDEEDTEDDDYKYLKNVLIKNKFKPCVVIKI